MSIFKNKKLIKNKFLIHRYVYYPISYHGIKQSLK